MPATRTKRKRRLHKGEPYVVYLPTHAGYDDGRFNRRGLTVDKALENVLKDDDAKDEKWGDYERSQYRMAFKIGLIEFAYQALQSWLPYATNGELDAMYDQLTEMCNKLADAVKVTTMHYFIDSTEVTEQQWQEALTHHSDWTSLTVLHDKYNPDASYRYGDRIYERWFTNGGDANWSEFTREEWEDRNLEYLDEINGYIAVPFDQIPEMPKDLTFDEYLKFARRLKSQD